MRRNLYTWPRQTAEQQQKLEVESIKQPQQNKTHRATRPTGNCRPALADCVTDFLALLPLPRPDIVLCSVACREGATRQEGVL